MATATATRTESSVCPLDCPDRCSLEVTVEEGRVTRLDGSHRHPLTAGFICSKVRGFADRVYGPDRLRYPQRRTGAKGEGRFERISWDAALDLVARRLREIRETFGGESILPYAYGGSNGMLAQGTLDEAVFRRLGASRLDRTVCAAPTGAVDEAMTGDMPGVAFEDYVHARLILLWGANPWHTHIHLVPFLKRAREAGARIVSIDPRRTASASYLDTWIPVYPGTDVVLALALIRELVQHGAIDHGFLARHTTGPEAVLAAAERWTLDEAARVTRVDAAQIAAVADAYASASPAVIRVGWGLERNRNGGSAAAAILALVAVAGKFGRPGGGYTLSASGAFQEDVDRLTDAALPEARHVNMNHLGRALAGELAGPPIQALFVYDCNPVTSVPDQNRILAGLAREDLFTVVFDVVQTDTADWADVLLPATTFLEQHELHKSYGSYVLQYAPPVIEPVGEARANPDVFAALGRALGFDDPEFHQSEDDLLARALGSLQGPHAHRDLARLKRERLVPLDFPGPRPQPFVTTFPRTPDGKMHLAPPALGPRVYAFRDQPEDPRFPLALISPASDKTVSTILGEGCRAEAEIALHPADAKARGLSHGARVEVRAATGSLCCRLRLDDRVRPGVASLAKGLWRRAFGGGASTTALVPDDLSEIGAGACFNDARVEVAPLA